MPHKAFAHAPSYNRFNIQGGGLPVNRSHNMTAMGHTMGTKAAPRKEVAAKKNKSTKKYAGAVSASVATYVNYQVNQLDHALSVASSSWPKKK